MNRYQNYVFTIATRYLANRVEAEDVAQEVFVRAWKHIEALDEGSAKSWLGTVTRNLCIDHLRARHTDTLGIQNQFEENEHEELGLELNKQQEPVALLMQSRLSQWIKKAIAALSEPYRSLLILRELEQMSYQEIAEQQKMNLNQVKVNIHRARQKLKQQLQNVEL